MPTKRKALEMPSTPRKKKIATAKAFIEEARSDQLNAQKTVQIGRPSLEEEVMQKSIKLRQEDVDKLELLMAQWTIKSKSKSRLGLSPIVRSVMTVVLPVLEELQEIPDSEDDLREILTQAIS